MKATFRDCFLALGVALAAPAAAQFIGTGVLSHPAPESNKPVIADITLQMTSISPWGTYTQTLSGKFWRGRNGDLRQDAEYGTTYIDSPRNKTRTWIDHELKTAEVAFHDFGNYGPAAISPRWSPDWRVIGETKIEGRKVSERHLTLKIDESNQIEEMWDDLRLGIVVQYRQSGKTSSRLEQLINIQERDPDPELFNIPDGYSIIHCKPEKDRNQAFCLSGGSDPRSR